MAGSARFQVGDRVLALMKGSWEPGKISQLWWREESWDPGRVAPYQIRLDTTPSSVQR